MRIASVASIALSLTAAVAIGLESSDVAAPPSIATRQQGGDWPDFLGPRRNGKSSETDLPDSWQQDGPRIVWSAPIGATYAAPVVNDGRLFHFARYGDVERLKCLNAETGEPLWECDYATDYVDMLGYNNGPRATPVVDGPRVYTFGAEGLLQCVNVETGKPIWRVGTMEQFHVVKNFFGVGSTPLVYEDLLLVNVGGSPPGGPRDVYAASGRVRSSGSAVVAFDKLTGDVRWQTGDDLASYASPVLAEVGGSDVVFVFAREGLLAIDPQAGKTTATFPWRARRLESVNASSPVVVGDEVFISETYELGSALVRYAGAKFEEIWTDRGRRRDRAMALHWNTPIAHEGFLYGSSGYRSSEAELRCVEWSTGRVAWSEPGMGRASLLLVEGVLVCLSEDGVLRLVRVNSERYEPLAEWNLKSAAGERLLEYPAWSAPVLARGLLYVQGKDRLVCLELIPQQTDD